MQAVMNKIRTRRWIGLLVATVVVGAMAYSALSAYRQVALREALIRSVLKGEAAGVQAALEQGADANERYQRNSPAPVGFWAWIKSYFVPSSQFGKGSPILFYAVRAHNSDITRLLLKHGASTGLNETNFGPFFGRTVLFDAVDMDDPGIVRTLIARGVKVDGRDWTLMTPLVHAITRKHYSMADTLLEQGADPNARDQQQRTIMDFAIGSLVPLPVLARLLDHGAHLDAPGQAGLRYTPLMCAVRFGKPAAVRFFLERGANPKLRSAGGLTAYQIGRKFKRTEAVKMLQAAGISK